MPLVLVVFILVGAYYCNTKSQWGFLVSVAVGVCMVFVLGLLISKSPGLLLILMVSGVVYYLILEIVKPFELR